MSDASAALTPSAVLRAHPQAVGVAACAAAPVLTGLLAVAFAQDANWDLRNYHWYNGYAALTGRHALDLAPAHTPTYFNPLLDIGLQGLAQAAPAKAVAFFLGFIQGLNYIPLYLVAMAILPGLANRWFGAVCAAVAAVGLLGGGHLGLIGTTFFDNVVCLPILAGVCLIVQWIAAGGTARDLDRSSCAVLAAAGLLVGIGVGLKLPAATYGLAFCGATLLIGGPALVRLTRAVVVGVSALAGVALTGGWWMAHLYATTGNPLFPLFNQLFRSPLALPEGYRDTQYVPGSVLEALSFPFRAGFSPRITGEIEFADYRIAALAAVGLLTALLALARRARSSSGVDGRVLAFLGTFVVVSYVAWLAVFAIYRYVIAIEMLAPIVTVACLAVWPIAPRTRAILAVGVMAILGATTRPGDWGRVPWSDRFVEVEAPPIADGAMVLMVGYTPTAWTIPAFPAAIPFVRVHGFSFGPTDGDAGFTREARTRVAGHGGSFHLLADRGELESAVAILAHFGLVPNLGDCQAIKSNLDDGVRLCAVARLKGVP
jgi:hypothetical protein